MSRPHEYRVRIHSTLKKESKDALKQLADQLGLNTGHTLDKIIMHYCKK